MESVNKERSTHQDQGSLECEEKNQDSVYAMRDDGEDRDQEKEDDKDGDVEVETEREGDQDPIKAILE